ncbi:MAG TPA: hypothetical protein V6C58_14015 [Allocoleopsis sp.]
MNDPIIENTRKLLGDFNIKVEKDLWEEFYSLFPKKAESTSRIKKCDCSDEYIIYTDHEIICSDCGLILDYNFVNEAAEWNTYNEDITSNSQKYSSVRCEKHDSLFVGYSTSGKISGSNSKLKIMNDILNKSSISFQEQTLFKISKRIEIISRKLKLPKRIERDTVGLYKNLKDTHFDNSEISSGKLIKRGKNNTGLLSICFYYACKRNNCCILQETINEHFEIDTKTFSKCYKFYSRYIDSNIKETQEYRFGIVDRIFVDLQISEFKIQKICKKILNAIEELDLLGNRSYKSIVSGVINFVNIELGINIPKTKISEKCKISLATIEKMTKIILSNKILIYNYIKS